MDQKKMGEFIAGLRKAKNMTQKELAEKLNVTDKAVSKWERGAGYPDITSLPQLALLLGVSVNEILAGHRTGADAVPEDPASQIVAYAGQAQVHYHRKTKRIIFLILSAMLLLGTFICMLCNYAACGTFNWSLLVTGAEFVVWLCVIPLFLFNRYRLIASAACLTLTSLPLLKLIEWIYPSGSGAYSFVLPILAAALTSMWATVLLISCKRLSRLLRTSLLFLIYGVSLNLYLSFYINGYFHRTQADISVLIVALASGCIAVLLAIASLIFKEKGNKNKEGKK